MSPPERGKGVPTARAAWCVVRGDEDDSRDEEINLHSPPFIGCNPRTHGISPATPQLNIEY